MSLRWITDWRGKARHAKAQRQRKCDIASVSPDWGSAPAVLPLVYAQRHLIGCSPGYTETDGIAAGPEFLRQVREWARDEGHDLMPDGQRLVLWESGDHRQKSYAINMADPVAAIGFARMLALAFPWAHGWHGDYWTNLGWIAEAYGKPYAQDGVFWARWDEGLGLAAHAVRQQRPGWIVVAQQFRPTPATQGVNGLFLEVRPDAFGMTLQQHVIDKAVLAVNGLESVWCAEIREPERYPADRVVAWQKWAENNGIHVALGRDATAQGE